MYTLHNSFVQQKTFPVIVVGCGGTGGFAAQGLSRILPKKAHLILIDHDRVEEQNLLRQNFRPDEIGMLKSEALAKRLAREYRRPVAYTTFPVAMADISVMGIIVGCVDNGLARADIAKKVKTSGSFWWVDAGNGENFGQVLIGNAREAYFWAQKERCLALPLPTVQRPELLSQVPPPQEPCEEFPEQGPTINQVMAVLVVEVVRRIIEGSCRWMQLLLDMNMGTLIPVPATPEAAIKIIGKSKVRVDLTEIENERR